MSVKEAPAPHAEQKLLSDLFSSRYRLAFLLLVLEIFIFFPLTKTLLFVVGLFNIPVIGGLILCLEESKVEDYRMQKLIKLLLRVGIAKSFGGVLLAVFMGLRYASLPSSLVNEDQLMNTTIKSYAISFVGSAIVDVIYSILAVRLIKQTKAITSLLKEKEKERKKAERKSKSPPKLPSNGGSPITKPQNMAV